MSPDELARLAAELDDVDVVHNQRKWPISGHPRGEAGRARGRGLVRASPRSPGWRSSSAYLFWPYHYEGPQNSAAHAVYLLYTPIIGITFGLSVLALGIGAIVYVKKFFPDEVSIQQRHDGPSPEVARKTVLAQLAKAGADTDIARRSLIMRSAVAAAGIFGLGMGIATIAPLVRDPWKERPDSALWTTGWKSVNGETVYLRRDTGIPDEISLVRPEDQEPGSMETVFPFRESERGDEEALLRGAAPIRQPGDADPAAPGHPGRAPPGPGEPALRRLLRLLQAVHPPGLPDLAVRDADPAHPVPVPPVAVHRDRVRQAGVRSGRQAVAAVTDYSERGRLSGRHR